LLASTTELPAPLQRFRHPDSDMVARDSAPELAFPGDGEFSPLMVKVRNGVPPFTSFANDVPFGRPNFARQDSWDPDGSGYVTLSVVDAEGRCDSVRVLLN
ncbi:MAG: penicillin-binding protein 1C, partial [Candidatus Devosia euplotis]|nr:penicillin-binding protein 1C [Candidatus Devosia euplotis]